MQKNGKRAEGLQKSIRIAKGKKSCKRAKEPQKNKKSRRRAKEPQKNKKSHRREKEPQKSKRAVGKRTTKEQKEP
ncbi:MAG: hypothetical protein HFH91_01660 [Lachnospiraceae bacterium]|nr:hypothetical protein [Lachnospiraceae bacterium]